MPRRPSFGWSSLPLGLTYDRLVTELNRRFGRVARALEDFPEPFALTYGTTVSIDARVSTYFTLTVTNGVAFTVNFPTELAPGQPVAIEFLNSSGGAMGAVTFGAGFNLAGAFAAPANTKRRVYAFLATSIAMLIEQYRSQADI